MAGRHGFSDRMRVKRMPVNERPSRRPLAIAAIVLVLVCGAGVWAAAASGLFALPGTEQEQAGGTDGTDAGSTSGQTEADAQARAAEKAAERQKAAEEKAQAQVEAEKEAGFASSAADGGAATENGGTTGSGGSGAGKTVCIDAGHSGHADSTPSSASPYSDETIATEPGGTEGDTSGSEYQVNLDVALLLGEKLEAEGFSVVQVRTDNSGTYSPKARAEVANECGADLFIRLHCDSAGSSASGFLTLVPGDAGYQGDEGRYEESQRIGRALHESIVAALGENDRGVVVREDQGGFNWCKVPCVLFEMGNMDNAHDDKLLATDAYKRRLADAMADACVEVLG